MRRPALYAILVGGSIAGAIDISYAIGFSAYRGVAPSRILQSVASGLLGKDAFAGGTPVALLGLALHFLIAYLLATIFYNFSRGFPILVRRAGLFGPLFGAAVYVVMNFVVLPLSAFPGKPSSVPVIIATGVLVHMFGIGLPIALAARRADPAHAAS